MQKKDRRQSQEFKTWTHISGITQVVSLHQERQEETLEVDPRPSAEAFIKLEIQKEGADGLAKCRVIEHATEGNNRRNNMCW